MCLKERQTCELMSLWWEAGVPMKVYQRKNSTSEAAQKGWDPCSHGAVRVREEDLFV